ncbi:hypothetical protein TNCV_927431 [Trichonephila clavipes]|nr:hypothetical protein TNCV_927431 [Trichonephila clavipes]
MIVIVFKASADFGEKFAKLCNPADCHPHVSFPSPLLKKCSLFNDFRKLAVKGLYRRCFNDFHVHLSDAAFFRTLASVVRYTTKSGT